MNDFFKGYIKTKDKQAAEKFKGRNDFKSYEEVQVLPEFAGVLAEDAILIDIDDPDSAEIMMQIVEDFQLNCRVYQTTRGKHFLFRNTKIDKCATHVNLACGLTADIKIGSKNSYEVLKFNGEERFIEWDKEPSAEYEELPKWMYPVRSSTEFLGMAAGDGRNEALFTYILALQSADFSIEEVKETLRVINRYVIDEPLSDEELEVIMREDAFQMPVFFKGTQFLFEKFAVYLKNQHHIIRVDNQLYLYHDGIYVTGARIIEHMMIEHIPNLNRAKRQEVLDYLDRLILENTPRSSPTMIAFRNGIYNISDGSFHEFSPDYVITNMIPWDYNAAAYSEFTDQTVDNIACHDTATRSLMEEMIGYCMFARNELGKAFILTGSGSNGKSTFLNMIKKMIGKQNLSVLDLKKLNDRFSTVMLFGKLANIGDDISDEFLIDASEFKKVVTGETIDAEYKGKDKFDFEPYCKLIFSANNIPRMGKGRDSGAVLRRLVIVPFNARFSKDSPDYKPYIGDELGTQESMEYLIQIGLKGLKRVLGSKSFTSSDAMEEELKEYEEMNNPVLAFFRDLDNEGFEVEGNPTSVVYRKYNEWCIINSLQPMSNGEFSKQVKKHYGMVIVDKRVGDKKHRIFKKG